MYPFSLSINDSTLSVSPLNMGISLSYSAGYSSVITHYHKLIALLGKNGGIGWYGVFMYYHPVLM